jgi:hypothetical protein
MTARPNIFIPVAVLSVMTVFPSGRANAGPPFPTDDPEPVPYQHFEFYNLLLGTAIRGDTTSEGPAWEYNYGIVPNGQIHIIAPLAFDAPAGGPVAYGLGDTELGFKYRFIGEDKNGALLMIGVYPLVELPTGGTKLAVSAPATFAPIFRSGCRKASAIGRPMAAVASGSIRATTPPIVITGSSAGSYKNK